MRYDVRLIDTIASALAAAAGIVWADLPAYPGYSRNCWREAAEAMIDATGAMRSTF